MTLKWEKRSTRKKARAYDTFPKPQTRKLANKRMIYIRTSFPKLIGICIYIYSLSSYLAVDTVLPSERPMGE